jgi:hypothetical protein
MFKVSILFLLDEWIKTNPFISDELHSSLTKSIANKDLPKVYQQLEKEVVVDSPAAVADTAADPAASKTTDENNA